MNVFYFMSPNKNRVKVTIEESGSTLIDWLQGRAPFMAHTVKATIRTNKEYVGYAFCSPLDTYDYKKGAKVAFEEVLNVIKYDQLYYRKFRRSAWLAFFLSVYAKLP